MSETPFGPEPIPAPGANLSPSAPLPAPPEAGGRRLVLCLDGTWNSTYDRKIRDDGSPVLKPTNVLKLCRALKAHDAAGQPQIAYYDIGVGSLASYPGTANFLLALADRALGGSQGAGFEGNIEDSLHFLMFNYEAGDRVYLFGFSRGAATAQAITRFLDWSGGLPTRRDAYYLPELFREYVAVRGSGDATEAVGRINARRGGEKRNRPLDPFRPVRIELLGVWDTVMALGSRFRDPGPGTATASKSFHVGARPALCVRHARQALAIDERRDEFRPEIWTGCAADQTLEQRWFAGVHSNVGGGYPNDGLANLALRWIVREAQATGLALDSDFLKIYAGFPQGRQYRSDSLLYRLLEMAKLRRGKGVRHLFDPGRPAGASFTLAASVIHRLAADPADPAFQMDGRPYRPENVLDFLSRQPDLAAYLASVPDLKPEHRTLPADVLRRIETLRTRAGLPRAG